MVLVNVLNVTQEYRDRQNPGAGTELGRRPSKLLLLLSGFEEPERQRACVEGDSSRR